jgi:hypothetical protein
MSDQDRDKIAAESDESIEEVDAHKLMKATDEDGGDDVEAHRHGGRDRNSGRDASGEGGSDDDVEAHKLQGRG